VTAVPHQACFTKVQLGEHQACHRRWLTTGAGNFTLHADSIGCHCHSLGHSCHAGICTCITMGRICIPYCHEINLRRLHACSGCAKEQIEGRYSRIECDNFIEEECYHYKPFLNIEILDPDDPDHKDLWTIRDARAIIMPHTAVVDSAFQLQVSHESSFYSCFIVSNLMQNSITLSVLAGNDDCAHYLKRDFRTRERDARLTASLLQIGEKFNPSEASLDFGVDLSKLGPNNV
jgi:hypothetical protein